jgi:ABC-type multidrug transport system fused ATPase/permease subunit
MNKTLKLVFMIISIIGLLFWTVCCFLGLYFATDGKLMIAIPVALVIALALFFSYLLMLKMQDKSATQGNRDRAKTLGIIMLCVYAVVTVCSAFYINHLVKTYDSKSDIQRTAAAAIEELDVTFSEDANTENSYRDYVYTELGRYKRHVRVNPESITTDTTLLWPKFNESLLENGYQNLETTVNETTSQIRASVVDGWYLPTLLTRLKELERKTEWEEKVVEFSKNHEYTQDDPFVPVSTVSSANLSDPLTHADFKVSIPAILIMLALQVIILLGYLLGLKTGGKNDKIITNDHGSMRSWSSSN